MPDIAWLHLSDLHFGNKPQAWLWPTIRQEFLADLTKLHALSGPWDLVLFTGDLVNKGDTHEFESLNDELSDLWKCMNALGSNPMLLAVPGNHDLKRPKASDALSVMQQWHSRPELQQRFWKLNATSRHRNIVIKAFSNYRHWWNTHPFPKPPIFQSGLLPGDFSATVEKNGVRLGIVGLNSTFLQLTSDNYEEQLVLDPRQFQAACPANGVDWLRGHHVSLLMTHHPAEWLHKAAQINLNAEIAPPGRFAVHLFGHLHKSRASTTSAGGALPWRHWQAASLFGLEHWGVQNSEQRIHGYAVGKLTIDADACHIQFWPRTAVRDSHYQFWKVIPDHNGFSLHDREATRPEMIALNCSLTGTTPPPHTDKVSPPAFRVLLISTEDDLADARGKTAGFLKRAMGLLVTELSGNHITGPHNIEDFDLAILLQGWWWADGKGSRVWSSFSPDKRLAFTSDDSSDWPPRRLAEHKAQHEVSSFRSSLQAYTSFNDPEELPELVGKQVGDYLERLRVDGEASSSLKRWERAYLGTNLPAWLAGRTGAGRTYLVNPEERTELYQPDLYVPLEGESPRWIRGEDGSPVKLLEDNMIDVDPQESRVSLGRWACAPDVPRIVLVGAPGGGKTVSLTRIAAAAGMACLGRPGVFEEDFDLDSLRLPTGTLPIPLVVEATRIAKSNLDGVLGVLSVICDEISHCGESKPNELELGEGLRLGRYILLIDALDEISDAEKRSAVLLILKGMASIECYPRARIIITTRSARYTGDLAFGPEFEVVAISLMSPRHIDQFCRNWCHHRKRTSVYLADLQATVGELSSRTMGEREDEALTTNPLMLTAICMIYERYKTLPEDRGKLCSLLVDDLCRSRRSEDVEHDWRLADTQKRDLLQRIALAMQREGVQSWPVGQARELALAAIGPGEVHRNLRADRHLHWAADHTGLLRFSQTEGGGEEVRFWHRLFREYLAASRLAQEDRTAAELMQYLNDSSYLKNPFWQDVICLLPSTLGTREKAERVYDYLLAEARSQPEGQGRYLGLALGAVIESRELFPHVQMSDLTRILIEYITQNGDSWEVRDLVFVLDGLGRLDPETGDPRLGSERFVSIPECTVMRPRDMSVSKRKPQTEESVFNVQPFSIGWAPVTVQEYKKFIESADRPSSDLWLQCPEESRMTIDEEAMSMWRHQLRHPNRPVAGISWYEAVAYTRWLSSIRTDGATFRLPTMFEYLAVFTQDTARAVAVDDDSIDLGSLLPVGSACPSSVGNEIEFQKGLYEWCNSAPSRSNLALSDVISKPLTRSLRVRVLDFSPRGTQGRSYPTAHASLRFSSLGFRLVRIDK